MMTGEELLRDTPCLDVRVESSAHDLWNTLSKATGLRILTWRF